MSDALRASCFDASALVKVYVDEPNSDLVRKYFQAQSPTKYTTPFCFYETLTALKAKWLRKQLSREQYLDAAFRLTAWAGASSRTVKDINLLDPRTFARARAIAERNNLDISDAFQILSVKEGYFSVLVRDSMTLLVTADERLADSAGAEGIKAWHCTKLPIPR